MSTESRNRNKSTATKNYGLTTSDIHEVLANYRRRTVIEILRDNGALEQSDLVDRVAARELDKPIQDINPAERKRVYVGLYQCHLPKLRDYNVVTRSKETNTYRLTSDADDVLPYLDGKKEGIVSTVVGKLI